MLCSNLILLQDVQDSFLNLRSSWSNPSTFRFFGFIFGVTLGIIVLLKSVISPRALQQPALHRPTRYMLLVFPLLSTPNFFHGLSDAVVFFQGHILNIHDCPIIRNLTTNYQQPVS